MAFLIKKKNYTSIYFLGCLLIKFWKEYIQSDNPMLRSETFFLNFLDFSIRFLFCNPDVGFVSTVTLWLIHSKENLITCKKQKK